MAAIGSNSCGLIAPIARWEQLIGSNSCGDEMRKFLPWQQLGANRVDYLRQLLQWEQLGAIRLDKLTQLLTWGAVRVVTNCANCFRGSNGEQFV